MVTRSRVSISIRPVQEKLTQKPINARKVVRKVVGVRGGPSQGHILRSKFITSSTDNFNLFILIKYYKA